MSELFGGLGFGHSMLLVFCIAIALAFEFVNGFHDTANAVATVIYTHTLPPRVAVVLSGLFNFTGVLVGGIAVAIGIINLLPVELLVEKGTGAGLAMVLALLLSAMLWNVGTWYLGLPASSSHTLIGAILGVGLANSALNGHFGQGVNWHKAEEIGLSLLVSPLFGFFVAGSLLWLVKRYTKNAALLSPPPSGEPPPIGTRGLLVATCCGVSFAHGSNDGQKGVGLVMLILMGLAPAAYSLDRHAPASQMRDTAAAAASLLVTVRDHHDAASAKLADETTNLLASVRERFSAYESVEAMPSDKRFEARRMLLLADGSVAKLVKTGGLALDDAGKKKLEADRHHLRELTDYAPTWVLAAIALALGLGTMIGWKRIVITVGEKIGKAHLSYAQGAAAEVVAASTILAASRLGLPVSTTHVLSSGIAGTMVAQGSGVQGSTVTKIALAWVLTLPAAMTFSAVLFVLLRLILV